VFITHRPLFAGFDEKQKVAGLQEHHDLKEEDHRLPVQDLKNNLFFCKLEILG
jgi:hypothetical protein